MPAAEDGELFEAHEPNVRRPEVMSADDLPQWCTVLRGLEPGDVVVVRTDCRAEQMHIARDVLLHVLERVRPEKDVGVVVVGPEIRDVDVMRAVDAERERARGA